MKKLFSYDINYGRGYGVEGLFIATQKEVDLMLGNNIYFGEICGKHSEIDHTFKKEDLTVVNVSLESLKELEDQLGDTLSGYNPVEYFQEALADGQYDEEDDDEV